MSLTLRSSFSLEAPMERAWGQLTNVQVAAPCFPGTQLLGQNEDGSWKANFVVKLGPMSFVFEGRFLIAEADADTRHVLVKASGTDKKGRGGAQATVDVRLVEEAERTVATLVSTVDLSGSVAQFGRGAGMIEALSRQLIDQFALNLQRTMPADEPASATVDAGAGQDHALGQSQPQALNGGSLFLRAMFAPFRNWLRRVFLRRADPASSK